MQNRMVGHEADQLAAALPLAQRQPCRAICGLLPLALCLLLSFLRRDTSLHIFNVHW